MGKALSKVRGHFVTRPLQRYNVDVRAEKVLSKAKEVAMRAPKYKSDEKLRTDIVQDLQEEVEKATKQKDDVLYNRLKQVYVNSKDPDVPHYDPDINSKRPMNPNRPYPRPGVRGFGHSGFILDEEQVKNIPAGRITLANAEKLLAKHRTNKQKYHAGYLAKEYNLDLAQTESLLDYFRIFSVIKAKDVIDEEIAARDDPYRAQPDWVEAAGEEPPYKMPKLDLSMQEIPNTEEYPKLERGPTGKAGEKPKVEKLEDKK